MKLKLEVNGERTSVKKFCAHYGVTPEQVEIAVAQYARSRVNRHKRDAAFKTQHGVTYSAARLRKKREAEKKNRLAAEERQGRDLSTRTM